MAMHASSGQLPMHSTHSADVLTVIIAAGQDQSQSGLSEACRIWQRWSEEQSLLALVSAHGCMLCQQTRLPVIRQLEALHHSPRHTEPDIKYASCRCLQDNLKADNFTQSCKAEVQKYEATASTDYR